MIELSQLKTLNSSQIDNLKLEAEKELSDNIKHQTILELEISALRIQQIKLHLRQKELEQSLLKAKSISSQLRIYISQLKSLFLVRGIRKIKMSDIKLILKAEGYQAEIARYRAGLKEIIQFIDSIVFRDDSIAGQIKDIAERSLEGK